MNSSLPKTYVNLGQTRQTNIAVFVLLTLYLIFIYCGLFGDFGYWLLLIFFHTS